MASGISFNFSKLLSANAKRVDDSVFLLGKKTKVLTFFNFIYELELPVAPIIRSLKKWSIVWGGLLCLSTEGSLPAKAIVDAQR